MPTTKVNLDIPDDLPSWRKTTERAKDIYWIARRNGADENAALLAALDGAMRDRLR